MLSHSVLVMEFSNCGEYRYYVLLRYYTVEHFVYAYRNLSAIAVNDYAYSKYSNLARFMTPRKEGYVKYYSNLRPSQHSNQYHFQNFENGPLTSFIDALESIANNDELHCVPRLLCELTSSGQSGGTITEESPLPFNVNSESLLG